MEQLHNKYRDQATNLEVRESLAKRMLNAKVRGDTKELHKLFKMKLEGLDETHILKGIEGVNPENFDGEVVTKYVKDLSAPYVIMERDLCKHPKRVSHLTSGTLMYQTGYSHRWTAPLMSMISSGKAVGLDPMTDKFLKRPRNFRYLA